jgi:hypothetical protein
MAKNPDETAIMQKIAELRQILRDTIQMILAMRHTVLT